MKDTYKFLWVAFVLCVLSCSNRAEYNDKKKLTVQDIEIFKDTDAWDLIRAVDKSNVFEIQSILKKHPKLVNFQDPIYGTTALMRAVSSEKHQSAQALLENGADPDIISKTGTTALFRAISHSWEDVMANEDSKFVKLLLDYKADPNINYCSPKIEGQTDPIECGTSPLMHSTTRGLGKTKLLVGAGAKINYKTKLGTTAAIKALLNEKVDVAYYLVVEQKAKVNEPYYYYYLNGRSEINYDKPHFPIELLENWLLDLNSKEHRMKMEIVKEFKIPRTRLLVNKKTS